MARSNFYLGFDGGGTKTECLILDDEGRIIAQGNSGPSNALRVGFEKTFVSLAEAGDQALSIARLDSERISGVCAGLAGAGRPRVVKRIMAYLVEKFPVADVHVTTDVDVALEAAVGAAPGVVLIAGTGSMAYGRNAASQVARAGGVGPKIGDEGSAYDIGRRAVAAVARARDGLAPVTILADLIPEALECPTWDMLVEQASEQPDLVFPRLYPVVVEAAEAEDDPAREILFKAALALGQIGVSVIRRLDLEKSEFPLIKAGGVFGHSRLLDTAVDALLASAAPRARIDHLKTAPAIGAARMAIRLMTSASKAAHGAHR
ncbi:MAG: hypothetical protein HY046_09670 [Acidobacteria bacterium]|nr:hypothetical protein [Acidobacteriota bacterium]